MSNIKKIIEEEKRKKRDEEQKEWREFSSSSVMERHRSNELKAEKLLTFSDYVIAKFANETNLCIEYVGTHSDYGNCLACYALFRFEKGFFRDKKYKAGEIIIGRKGQTSGVGYIPSSVLGFGGKEVGAELKQEEITEEWFMRMLASHFVNLI
jgi:hypothetical protein